jgi:hypothetical protein
MFAGLFIILNTNANPKAIATTTAKDVGIWSAVFYKNGE